MNALSHLALLSITVCGCDQKAQKPEVATTTAPAQPPAATPAPAAPVVPKPPTPTPVANERRADGNGFTVALPPAWEPRTVDPTMFGAMRGQTSTIQIMSPTKDPDRAKYTAAASDRSACDAVFQSLAAEMQVGEFVAPTQAGCERETSISGMVLVAMIRVVEGRPIFAMCGGDPERKVWEPECRAIVASLRWEAGTTALPVRQSSVKTEVLADGTTRVNADGLEVTLVPGWSLRADAADQKLTATRARGIGLLTLGLFDTPMPIASAEDCQARASTFATDLGGTLTSRKLEGGRCVLAMTIGSETAETVLAPGARGDTVFVTCVRGTRDVEAATECKSMLASTVDRR